VVLFGKTFLPDYPQCELRMARFRALHKTEVLDQRHVRAPAFKCAQSFVVAVFVPAFPRRTMHAHLAKTAPHKAATPASVHHRAGAVSSRSGSLSCAGAQCSLYTAVAVGFERRLVA